MRRRADRALELAHGLLGLVDPGRALRQPERDELGQQLVEVAAEGRLLGDLAQGGDGDDVAQLPPVGDRAAPIVEHDPGAAPVPVLEGAEVGAQAGRRLGREHGGQRRSVRGEHVPPRRGDALQVRESATRAQG